MFEGILDSLHSRSSVLCHTAVTHSHDVGGREPKDSSQNVSLLSSHWLPR